MLRVLKWAILPIVGVICLWSAWASAAVVEIPTIPSPLPELNPDAPSFFESLFSALLTAIKAGNWGMLLALVLMGLVYLLRHEKARLTSWIPFLGTDPGGVLMALVTSFLATWAATGIAGQPFLTVSVILGALKLAFYMSGGYTLIKKLLYPFAMWIYGKVSG